MTAILLFMLQGVLGMSFDQIAETALAQNKSLQAAREQLRQAEARLTQAGLHPNPTLDLARSTDVMFENEGDSALAVTLSQPFEIGGKRTSRIRVAEAEVDLAKAEIADAERQLLGQLRTAYLRAAETSARLNLLERTRGLNQQMAQVMNVRLASGDASQLESHLLQAENNRVEAQRLQAESQLTDEMFAIRKFAGILPTEQLSLRPPDVSTSSIPRSEAELFELALRSRPDLQAARLREALADAGIALARSQAVPNITGSVRYAREPTLTRFRTATLPRAFEQESVLEFGISIPLPFSNREQGHIREAASKIKQAQAEREALENSVRVEVAAAARRYQSALRSLELIRTGVVSETEAGFSITQLAYRLGNARLVDVIFQQRSLIEAQIAELSAQMEIGAAQAALELAIGLSDVSSVKN
jgi:cobalt-zinc-cadmium efflux system outer membrane protein